MSTEQQLTIGQKLNTVVLNVLSQKEIDGFQKAFVVSQGINELRKMLTPEYMKPIMEMQGTKLGFKSDKVYDEKVVKECLIEAVFLGLQPYGNEFNIIGGNCYATKEGLGSLLKKMVGLNYEIIPQLPRINADKTSAAIIMKIVWSMNGGTQNTREIEIPVKMNQYMGTDAVIGKATRKARAWLYGKLNDCEVPEGDVTDADFKIVDQKPTAHEISKQKEYDQRSQFIESAKTIEQLEQVEGHLEGEQIEMFKAKKNSILDASN